MKETCRTVRQRKNINKDKIHSLTHYLFQHHHFSLITHSLTITYTTFNSTLLLSCHQPLFQNPSIIPKSGLPPSLPALLHFIPTLPAPTLALSLSFPIHFYISHLLLPLTLSLLSFLDSLFLPIYLTLPQTPLHPPTHTPVRPVLFPCTLSPFHSCLPLPGLPSYLCRTSNTPSPFQHVVYTLLPTSVISKAYSTLINYCFYFVQFHDSRFFFDSRL